MNDWFKVEKIDNDTFVISEYKHYEESHSYLLCGRDKAVLIDTGLGISNIKKAVDSITILPILVLTTHVHWDHIGGHKYFGNIAVHEKEKDWIDGNFPLPLQLVKRNLTAKPCEFPKDFVLDSYEIFQGRPKRILHDNDCIDIGNRKVKVIHTPGHSPGHCCFYEEKRGYLYSGDLIYKGCLDIFYPTTNPREFWNSIKKVQALKVNKILPSHHDINIESGITEKIEKAFCELNDKSILEEGKGVFDFKEFQIHI